MIAIPGAPSIPDSCSPRATASAFLAQEEEVALFASDAWAGEVLRDGFTAGHDLHLVHQ
jgi:hypothetical protein